MAVFAMPNTDPAVIDEASLHLASERAASRSYCDYGLYVGATADNVASVAQLSRHAIGLKMYLNETFTTLSLAGQMDVWRKHFEVYADRSNITFFQCSRNSKHHGFIF